MSMGPLVRVYGIQKGFLLLEIMISLVILTSMAGVLASYQWQIARWQADARKKLQAVTSASEQLDQLFKKGAKAPALPKGITVQSQVQPYPIVPITGLEQGDLGAFYERITVTATWHDVGGQKHTLTLSSGVCRRTNVSA